MPRLLLALLLALPLFSADEYLFTSFRRNRETGVFFATSPDGRIGDARWLYFDHYAEPQHYGALRTKDWKTFEDVTGQVTFPAGHRHGSVVAIPGELARRLRER